MKITREFINGTNGFTQTEMKFAIFSLQKHQKTLVSNYIAKNELTELFVTAKNTAQLASKIARKLSAKRNENSIFGFIDYKYPGNIEYTYRHEIETAIEKGTDVVEFDESLLSMLSNTGNTLKLLLLLLFAIKDESYCFTTTELSTKLFGEKRTYNPQKSRNASANQLVKIQEAIAEINALTDYSISIEPIKSGHSITAFHFNVSLPNATATHTDNITIAKLLKSKGYGSSSQLISEFISLFATNDEAKEMIQYITDKTGVLLRTGIIKNDIDVCMSLARQAVIYPHTTPLLWYTTPKTQVLLEHYMYTHPNTFIEGIKSIINNNNGFAELVENIQPNKTAKQKKK